MSVQVGEKVRYVSLEGRVHVGRVTGLWKREGEPAFDCILVDMPGWRGWGFVSSIVEHVREDIAP
jgi:hypothetical protein